MPLGGGLADGRVSPRVIRCWFVPLVCFTALCKRLVYPFIDNFTIGFCRLSWCFRHGRIAKFALAPAQFLRAVKVLVQCHCGFPHGQSGAAGFDLHQSPLMLAGEVL